MLSRAAAATARRILRRHASTPPQRADAVVVGAGLVGVSTAARLADAGLNTLCVTRHPPCSYTSAVSTECYRDFWPSMEMAALMSRSIDLMEATAQGGIGLTRRGYAYCARQPETLAKAVAECESLGNVRHHATLAAYEPAPSGALNLDAVDALPTGFDVLHGAAAREAFPALSEDVVGVVHARRAGWVDSGRYADALVRRAKAAGVTFLAGRVDGVECEGGRVAGAFVDGRLIKASTLVNCAGPYLTHIHGMVSDLELPVTNEVHAKCIFRDALGAVPRDAPMMISLDAAQILEDDGLEDVFGAATAAKLAGLAPAVRARRPSSTPPYRHRRDSSLTQGVHLRPWGDDHLLLLWDYWHADCDVDEPPVDVPSFDADLYPEVCLRGLAGFIPGLRAYVDGESERPLIDGGYYTQTPENRPLIGPGGIEGYYVNGAFAGFGLMAAEAAGELCAAHVLGRTLPSYASAFAPARYANPAYPLEELVSRGGGSI